MAPGAGINRLICRWLPTASDCRHKMLATQLRELRRVRGDIERKLKVCIFSAVANALRGCQEKVAKESLTPSHPFFLFHFDLLRLDASALPKRQKCCGKMTRSDPISAHCVLFCRTMALFLLTTLSLTSARILTRWKHLLQHRAPAVGVAAPSGTRPPRVMPTSRREPVVK